MNAAFRYIASPDNRVLHVVWAVGCCVTLWGMRVPGYDLAWMIAGVSLFLIALLFILLRIVTRLVIAWRNRNRQDSPRITDGGLAWSTYALSILILVLLGLSRLPFKLAWVLSRPSLDRFAQSYDPAIRINGKRSIGLFAFSSIYLHEDHLRLNFDKNEFPWGQRGLYFSPNAAPADSSHYYGQDALGGGWYEWHYGGW